MSQSRLRLGIKGEAAVAKHLVAQGCHILEKRWRTTYAEIDLIIEDDGEVVFIEVKTRAGREFGYPEESITKAKQKHLRNGAHAYMQEHCLAHPYRIDVWVAEEVEGVFQLYHIPNAVSDEG